MVVVEFGNLMTQVKILQKNIKLMIEFEPGRTEIEVTANNTVWIFSSTQDSSPVKIFKGNNGLNGAPTAIDLPDAVDIMVILQEVNTGMIKCWKLTL